MTPYFIDTNIFLRHLLNDDPVLSPAAQEIIQAIEEDELTAWTSDLVIAELVFVLSSKRLYDLPRATIAEHLLPLIHLAGLKLPNKRVHDRAFALYIDAGIDYIDAYNASLMWQRGERQVLSFDTDFDRVRNLVRQEHVPEAGT